MLRCGRLQELKNKGKVQLGNPKSGRGRLRELFITKNKLTRIRSRKRPHGKTMRVVAYESFRNSLIIHKDKPKELIV